MKILIAVLLLVMPYGLFATGEEGTIDVEGMPADKLEAVLKLDSGGHMAKIHELVTTKSGDIITCSDDKTIRVWDSASGKEKRKILGQIGTGTIGKISAVALSPDERYLAVGGSMYLDEANIIRIHEYDSGRLIKIIKAHSNTILDLVFSEDGRYLVSGSGDKTAKIWDVGKGFKLRDTIAFHDDYVYGVAIFEQNGDAFAVTAGFDNKVALYSLKARRITASATLPYKLEDVAYSHGQIAVCGHSKTITVYDTALHEIQRIESDTAPAGLVYSKDGRWLLNGANNSPHYVNLYDRKNGYKKSITFKKHDNTTLALGFLDDETVVSAGGSARQIYVWNANSGEVIKRINGEGSMVWSVGIEADRIAWGIRGRDTRNADSWQVSKTFDLSTHRIEAAGQKHFKQIPATSGAYLLKHGKGGDYNLDDAVLHVQEHGIDKARIVRDATSGYRHRAYGFYKNYIVSGGDYGHVNVYTLEGKEIASLVGHTGSVWSVALEDDRLVSGSADQTIRVWDLSVLNEPKKFKLIKVVDHSPAQQSGLREGDTILRINGKSFSTVPEAIAYLRPQSTYRFEIDRRGETKSVTIEKHGQSFGFYMAEDLKDEQLPEPRTFSTKLIDSIKKRYPDIDINKPEDMRKLYYRLVLAGNPAANTLVKPLRIHPVISLFFTQDDEWVMWTDGGFFDASKNGAKYIGYHINQGPYKEAEYIAVENLYNTFYRPDLIQKALKGESLTRYAENINIDELLADGLAPEVKILTTTASTKEQDIDLKLRVCPKGSGGYDNLALTINDMPVAVIDTSRALKIKKKAKRNDCFTYDQTISLAGGKNRIGFKATNKAGSIESKVDYLEVDFDDSALKQKLRRRLAKASGDDAINDLHILAVAVNDYSDRDLKLKYSVNDASEMLKTVERIAEPLFNKVHVYKLFDKEVTKANLEKAFESIDSKRDDVFMLYIAGHGITDQYNGNYYYIPYDFKNKADEKAVQEQGIGQKDLMLGLSKVKALKSLVLLDTCNSGSFVEAEMQKTTTNRLAKATGRATISASSKSQVALEGYNDHGVFTYTLLEALGGKGYRDDKEITTNELADYVETTLPDLTYKKWGYRQMPQRSMYGVDFRLGRQGK